MLLFWEGRGGAQCSKILEEYDALFWGQNAMYIEEDNVTEG